MAVLCSSGIFLKRRVDSDQCGLVKLRPVGGSLMATVPKVAADALGLKEGDAVELLIRSPRDHVRPEVNNVASAALPATRPGLDVPRDR